MAKLSQEFLFSQRLFVFKLINGTLCWEVLGEVDYLAWLQEPSVMEQVFAVWGNVLDLNESGAPMNVPQAERRVAQYLRRMQDEDYVVEPPFEEWELELPW